MAKTPTDIRSLARSHTETAAARLFRIVQVKERYADRNNAAGMNTYEHIQARMAELAAPAVEAAELSVERVGPGVWASPGRAC